MICATLSISEILTNQRRLEGETYLTPGYQVRLALQRDLETQRVSSLADVWQPTRLRGTQVASDHGVGFLAATQVFDIHPRVRKWIAPSKTADYDKRFVQPTWLLMTCSGAVGDVTVAHPGLSAFVVSHDLLRIEARDLDLTHVLYFFFRSNAGRAMLRSNRYGSIIKHLEPEHVEDLPVPPLPQALVAKLRDLGEEAYRLRISARNDWARADALLEGILLSPARPDLSTAGFIVSASDFVKSNRRLDAFHYNPQAVLLENHLAQRFSTEPLGSLCIDLFGVKRFKHLYTNRGVPYLDSEDLFKGNPVIEKYIPRSAKADIDDYLVRAGTLLMACSGQIYGLNGSVMIASAWHENKIISNHVLRLVIDTSKVHLGYVAAFLGHPTLGRPLVIRNAFGTEVPEISGTDIAAINVPRLGAVEDDIGELVQRANESFGRADEIDLAGVQTINEYLDNRYAFAGLLDELGLHANVQARDETHGSKFI